MTGANLHAHNYDLRLTGPLDDKRSVRFYPIPCPVLRSYCNCIGTIGQHLSRGRLPVYHHVLLPARALIGGEHARNHAIGSRKIHRKRGSLVGAKSQTRYIVDRITIRRDRGRLEHQAFYAWTLDIRVSHCNLNLLRTPGGRQHYLVITIRHYASHSAAWLLSHAFDNPVET